MPGFPIESAERVVQELNSQGMAGMCLEGYLAEEVVYEHFDKHFELERKTGKNQEDSVMQWGIQVLNLELLKLLNIDGKQLQNQSE